MNRKTLDIDNGLSGSPLALVGGKQYGGDNDDIYHTIMCGCIWGIGGWEKREFIIEKAGLRWSEAGEERWWRRFSQ